MKHDAGEWAVLGSKTGCASISGHKECRLIDAQKQTDTYGILVVFLKEVGAPAGIFILMR